MAKCIITKLIDKCKSKTYHHGNLKEELLQEALKIIQEDGVEAVTLQALGNRLGTSRSAIYRHFSSKSDLMDNVMMYGFESFDSLITPIFELKDKDVIERLNLMGKTYMHFAIDNPNLFRMLFGERYKDLREDNCDLNDEDQANGYHSLINLIIEAQEKNIFQKKDDALVITQTVHAMIHGLTILYIDGHIDIKDNIENVYEVLFRTMTQGLKK
ncbi:MAG: TetR family transcriptional regulator [Arcobacter sp.]|nr:MAG: TetR family transcriptional regulator [Arcobacter sp.]